MHTEVHVHGDISLKRGAASADIEAALRPWLEYVDVDSLAEATSAREEEPGVALDLRKRLLQICWTGWVGRNFQRALESALSGLCEFVEAAAAIEVTYYQEDGRDEFSVVFVGPDSTAIEQAKRRRMIDDVAMLLSRQFSEDGVREVTVLIERLYEQQEKDQREATGLSSAIRGPLPGARKHLH